jgi:hypothetical protein
MLDKQILIDIHERTGTEDIRLIIAIEAIILSTKTKAKDFLEGSTSFKERVVRKFMRTKFLPSEESANKLYDLYYKINMEYGTDKFTLDNLLEDLKDVFHETNLDIE